MKRNKNPKISDSEFFFLELIKEKFESIMPDVNRQVKVYEERLKADCLASPPKTSPLFSE